MYQRLKKECLNKNPQLKKLVKGKSNRPTTAAPKKVRRRKDRARKKPERDLILEQARREIALEEARRPASAKPRKKKAAKLSQTHDDGFMPKK